MVILWHIRRHQSASALGLPCLRRVRCQQDLPDSRRDSLHAAPRQAREVLDKPSGCKAPGAKHKAARFTPCGFFVLRVVLAVPRLRPSGALNRGPAGQPLPDSFQKQQRPQPSSLVARWALINRTIHSELDNNKGADKPIGPVSYG